MNYKIFKNKYKDLISIAILTLNLFAFNCNSLPEKPETIPKNDYSYLNQYLKKDFSEKIFLFSRAGTYVVQIGDYAKREDAVALKERLKAKKITNCFIPPKN